MTKRQQQHGGSVPQSSVGLLTQTSKMPGSSWSLPAHKACPREAGDICKSCYASKGCYVRYGGVVNAQVVRFDWTRECMKSEDGRTAWVAVMVDGIRLTRCEYFRVHDSGDMFSPAYASCWLAVCTALPEVKFWIPTRVWQQPNGPLTVFDPLMGIMRKLAALPNVTVRPSALNFRDKAPEVPGLHAGSTAEWLDMFTAKQCGAPSNGGKCGECRVCWDDKSVPVSYVRH